MRIYVPSAADAKRFPDADVGIILCDHDAKCVGWDFILDNGAYAAWKNGVEWDEKKWVKLATRLSTKKRMEWAVVPDVVADRDGTLQAYHRWAKFMKYELGYRLAFAVQDGMTPRDIPRPGKDSIQPDVIFIGGTYEWKWQKLRFWSSAFPRIHVGKANTLRQLTAAHDAGAESVDGTGCIYPRGRRAMTQYLNRIKMPRILL